MRQTPIRLLLALTLAATLTACGGDDDGHDGGGDPGTSFSLTNPQASATGTGDQAGQAVALEFVDVQSAQVALTK